MNKLTLIATCGFGLEAVVKRELKDLGIEVTKTENGKVYFTGGLRELALANVWLRSSDRVLILIKEFEATSFEHLFDEVYDIDWPEILPKNGNFVVNAKSVKSKLFSLRDIQSISEKAIVEKLKTKYKINWFEKSGALYDIEVGFLKDRALVTLDTTGYSLHRRGYRKKQGPAPLKETLAASLVLLSFWNEDRTLYDPFCGSGTILFEACLIGKNIAPGLTRSFSFNNWAGIDHKTLKDVKDEAKAKIKNNKLRLVGTDIDPDVVSLAKEIRTDLGFEEDISLYNTDFRDFSLEDDYTVLITNPPYGDRLDNIDTKKLAKDFSNKFKDKSTWSKYILTSDESFEKNYNQKAHRKRKLFNGRIKVDYYQYYGDKPQRGGIDER